MAEALRVFYKVPVICEEEKESLSNILKRKIASSILHIPAERISTEKNFHALGVEKGISFSGEEVLQQYYLKGKYVATVRPFLITGFVMRHMLCFFESQHHSVPRGASSDL